MGSRVELRLSEAEKAGASQVFFTKVREELHIIPAQFKVIEYWQEKAVFDAGDGQQRIVGAPRPLHPLGKCCATPGKASLSPYRPTAMVSSRYPSAGWSSARIAGTNARGD